MQIKMWAKGYPTYILTLIFLFNCFSLKAQSNFAPVGATWYHSGDWGVYKSVVTKDTLYEGKASRKIEQDIFVKWGSLHPYLQTTRDLYIYDNGDTVFCYNDRVKEFTPLFVFNVNAGDTIRLPYFNPNDCSKVLDTNSLAISFVIDSVKNVNYDGTILKTVYSKLYKKGKSNYGWCVFDDSISVYAQKIGSLKTGFLPYCKGECAYTLGEGCATPRKLRCYEDDSIKVHLVDTCLSPSLVPASVVEKTNSTQKLGIYPNPAIDKIRLSFELINYQTKVIIVDVMGKKVFEKDFSKNATLSIDVAELKSGVYCIKLLKEGETTIGSGSFIKL